MTVTRIDVDEARALIDAGAVLVDVLPAETYQRNHLPGAVNRPLETMTEESVATLDRDAELIVYCFDQRCDLSARAAARLDAMGFTKVHDLIGGRAAWTVLGLPTEGWEGDRRAVAGFVVPVPSVPFDATIGAAAGALAEGAPVAVVDAGGVLLGALDAVAAGLAPATPVSSAMVPAPGTIRPDMTIDKALAQLRDDHLPHSFVTTARGELIGVLPADTHI
jgi:rhodanese-related sulfurtransferase